MSLFFIWCLEVYIDCNLIGMFHLFYKIAMLIFEIPRSTFFALHGLADFFKLEEDNYDMMFTFLQYL